MLEQILYSKNIFSNDAIVLSRKSLTNTLKKLYTITTYHFDSYTKAHIDNYIIKIESILNPEKQIN